MSKPELDYRIAPQHDARAYAQFFRKFGRLHIPNFLREQDAQSLYDALAFRTPWRLMLIHDGPQEITGEAWAAMPAEERQKIDRDVIEAAKVRFEGRFCELRFSDDGEIYGGDIPELTALSRFLNSPPFLAFIRTLTESPDIALADAQATLYRPGDFLHRHNDIYAGKNRVAAYVYNLTPRWQAEWGGLLGFLDQDGHVAEAYTPTWNALNILRVPQMHYVSHVAPFAVNGRYSVTGWLRRK
ncbi:MAG TPA: 2OG-Fe(II) oxygenase family protein [Rhizomicrobium sp.]